MLESSDGTFSDRFQHLSSKHSACACLSHYLLEPHSFLHGTRVHQNILKVSQGFLDLQAVLLACLRLATICSRSASSMTKSMGEEGACCLLLCPRCAC